MAQNTAWWLNADDGDDSKPQKPNLDNWDYYKWAGGAESRAKMFRIAQDPDYVSADEYYRLSNINTPQSELTPRGQTTILGEPEDTMTPGEKIAKMMGASIDNPFVNTGILKPLLSLADAIAPEKTEEGFIAGTRGFTSDFLRSATASFPQTVADISGTIADVVTGNTGKNQNYTLQQNAPEQYRNAGGVGQVVGSFAPDILLALGAYGKGASALAGLSKRFAAGEATGLAGRIGGWAAAGSETPTALKLFGRAISPAATRIERAAATLSATLPAALNVAPEVAAGRMNAAEGALNVGLSGAAGPFSAGQWAGSKIKNILGDVAVNVGAQAATEVVPAIVPGGAEFDAQQVWKNLAYGAAMGTMFGMLNSKPLEGPGERVTFGSRVQPEDAGTPPTPDGAVAGGATGGMKSKVISVAQETERTLFGETTLPDDASAQQAAQHLANIRARSATELRSITQDEFGNVVAFSDQYRATEPANAGMKSAVDAERDIYANTLASRYANSPETLVRILELETAPGEITPENAQQVLAAKIKNEWLIQPVEGKGIAGVEQRLAQAGLEGVVQKQRTQFVPEGGLESGLTTMSPADIEAQQLTPPSVIPMRGQAFRAPESSTPAPKLLGTPTALGPVSPRVAPQAPEQVLPRTSFESAKMLAENPPTQVAGLLPDAEVGPFNAVLIPRSGGPMQAPESTLRPEQIVDNAEQRLNSAKQISDEIGIPVESIVVPESVEAKLLEAEAAGVPIEDAKVAVAEEVAANPDAFVLSAEERASFEQAPTPAQEVIAGEQPITPAPKRPRKARTAAKNEAQAKVLESLEGPVEQAESNVVYKEQTARPETAASAAPIKHLARVIAENTESLRQSRENYERAKLQAEQEAKAAGGRKKRVKEVGRQSFRTAVENYNILENTFTDGAQVTIHPPSRGSKPTLPEAYLAQAEGVPVKALRAAVQSGQTEFLGGKLTIKNVDGTNDYIIKTNFTPEDKQIFLTEQEQMFRQKEDADVKKAASAKSKKRTLRQINEQAYEDLLEVFDKATDRNELYRTRSKGANLPEGVEFEFISEAFPSGEESSDAGTIESGGYAQESKSHKSAYNQWNQHYVKKLTSAVDYVQRRLSKRADAASINIPTRDVEFYVSSKTAPGKWRELAQLYVDNTMPANVRAVLDDEFNNITVGSPVGKTPLDMLVKHNTLLDDGYFDDLLSKYFNTFEVTMNAADVIARNAGIPEPIDVVRFYRWDNAGPTPRDKQLVLDQMNRESRTPVEFDEVKAEQIRQQINKVAQDWNNPNTPDVLVAQDDIIKFVNEFRGSQAVKLLLNENLMGGKKSYALNLRNLPTLRGLGLVGLMYVVDEGTDRIEDDETYFGFMPGSTLKKLFGNGEAGMYAAMSGGFIPGMKVTKQTGTKAGRLFQFGNSARRMIQSASKKIGAPVESYTSMTPAQQSEAADMFMAEKRPTLKPGTDAYEREKAGKILAEEVTAMKGTRLRNALDIFAKDKSKGTVGFISRVTNDINLMAGKSQFVKEFIVDKYTELHRHTREIMKKVEDPLNEVLPTYIKRYKNTRVFWDAFWALDYSMSELEVGLGQSPRTVLDDARIEVENEVKQKFFTNADGEVNEQMWADFMDLQSRIDPVRREHLRALVSKSMGKNSWEIESYFAELVTAKDRLNEGLGAAKEGYDIHKANLDSLNSQYTALRTQYGEAKANEMMPDYSQSRKQLERAVREHSRNLNALKRELDAVEKNIDTINNLDAALVKSTSNRYMFRLRDNSAPLVLRIEFNPESGLPSVRREYYSRTDAKESRADVLRDAVAKMQATSPEYTQYLEKKRRITDRLTELDAETNRTPEMDAEYERLENELETVQGYKPVSEMSDAEVFRFASDFEQLGADATIRDMRSHGALKKGSAAAKRVIDMMMSSTNPLKAQILSRTLENGSLVRPDTNQVDYVPNKGNGAIFDNSGSGQVLMLQGDEAPTIRDLVDAIDDMVDEAIDKRQLTELLEKFYTYRDKSIKADGTSVETVWVDMAALRKIVDAYTDPYIPNLLFRNNWVGYYDPDGKWTVKERIDYTIKSLEAMQSQIKTYNQQTALRRAIQNAHDYLDRWDIHNGMREYISGLQAYNDNYLKYAWADRLGDIEMTLRRGISFGTLMTGLGSAISNRLSGVTIASAHGIQNATTKYGVYETKSDGTRGEVIWMPSEAAARAELYARQEEGKGVWNIAQGFKARPLFNPKTYGLGIAAAVAPEKTLKWLARQDGYGKVPPSQYGKWAMIYEQANAARLQEGGIVGSYTVRDGINRQDMAEKAEKYLGAITAFVETQNNYSSILNSGLAIESRFGLGDADWISMNTAQKTDAAKTALAPYAKRLDETARAREIMTQQIQEIQQMVDQIQDIPSRTQERIRLEKEIESKRRRMQELGDEKQLMIEALTNYMVYDRNFEQGAWDKMAKTQAERFIESLPLGKISMTMTAPILRSLNSWSSMLRSAMQTQGGVGAKLGRAAAPAMGASILTILAGYAANPLIGFAGIFLTDIANLAETLYAYANEEDGEKLDKVSSRQAWEKIAEDWAPHLGIEPKAAKEFVRACWSEGLIRYYADVNVSAGAGILDIASGNTPAQVVLGLGKNSYNAAKTLSEYGGSGSPYDVMYSISNVLPTSMRNLSQTALQTVPSSLGGFGAVKVDKLGQPVYDKNQQIQELSGVDILRRTFLGKPWSETRSRLIMYEGGTPLYTENDRIAWANTLANTKHVQFGKSSTAAAKGKGTAEQTNAALFERDAEQLQKVITQKYANYREQVEVAKNVINDMYRNNTRLPLTEDGKTTMPFREILSIVASSGDKTEFEIKGSAPNEVRKSMLNSIDEWGRALAASEGVKIYYGGDVEAKLSEDMRKSATGDIFALRKLGRRFGNAYKDYQARQLGRSRTGQ